jgi:hypothetical protein
VAENEDLERRCHQALLRRQPKWRLRLVKMSILPAAAGLTALLSSPAGAAQTCAAGAYHYAGLKTNTQNYTGIERYISVDTASVANANTDHLINYLNASVTQVGCNGQTQCWIQVGYGLGNVGGHIVSSGHPYAEENDNNGYDVNWSPFALTQNDFHTVFFTGQTSSIGGGKTVGLFNAYSAPAGSGPILVAQAWLQDYHHTDVQASTESYNGVKESCPDLAQYQYFGTDGTTNNDSGTQLDVYSSGLTWEAWPGLDGHPYSDGVLGYNSLHNFGAFETWKEM